MFERFTDRARGVVNGAVAAAEEMGQRHIGTEHLLLALLASDGGVAQTILTAAGLDAQRVREEIQRPSDLDAAALEAIGIDLNAVRAKVEEAFGPGALDEVPREERRGFFAKKHKPFTPRAKTVLELSLREALALKHGYIGTEHILLGLLREGKGLAAKILADAGVDFADLRAKTIAAIPQR